MSLSVSISDLAKSDVAWQYDWYVKHADGDVADRYLGAFQKAIGDLSLRPEMGIVRRFRQAELVGMRAYLFSRPFQVHQVFYRIGANDLSIERVMHGARDLPRRLMQAPAP